MSDTRWVRAASIRDFGDRDLFGVKVETSRYVLSRVGDEIFAADDACTHQFARLSEGIIEDCTIECPVHYARFDLRTGRRTYGPVQRDLMVYPVKVDGEEIYIALPVNDAPG